jgi:acetate CoA/acetoacetate CoA-transferase beta subunit
VIAPMPAGLTLLETAPGVSVEQVLAATDARLVVPDRVPTMAID